MYVVHKGVDSIRKLLVFKAFFLPLAALALLWWAIRAGHGLGPILAQPSKFTDSGQFWAFFFPSLTGMVGFWATLSLNIPDFTRYATSQRAQQMGQAIGLPASMTLFSFVGVVVTSATLVIYGKTIWDPVVLAGRFDSKLLVSAAMLAVALSTLATNIAANIVSPANDFANFSPERISFKTGGYITGVIGLLIFPWKLIADPSGYIFTWLVGYSGLLGPIGGIMIVDYYLIRQQRLSVPELYQYTGRYAYRGGINHAAMLALVVGVLPNVPGFFTAIGVLRKDAVWPALVGLYNYAWFVGFAVSGLVYWMMMRGQVREPAAASGVAATSAVAYRLSS
jgi:NCS1 family nucleobase:cation symporter-1